MHTKAIAPLKHFQHFSISSILVQRNTHQGFYLSQTFSFIAAKAILDFILVTESGKTVLVMRKAYWSDVAWLLSWLLQKLREVLKKIGII